MNEYTYIYKIYIYIYIPCVPLATEPGISLIILPLMRILQRLQTHTTDTFLFISHTTNVLLFKFRCSIFIGVRIIKEMPGLVASGTHCIYCFPSPFWSTFSELEKRLLDSSLLSVCLSVRQPARPPFRMEQPDPQWNDFSRNFIFDDDSRICRVHSGFIKSWQKERLLYMMTNIQFWSYLHQFFIEWEMFQKKMLYRKSKHMFYVEYFFFPEVCLSWDMWKML